jgi:hypothetical protein
MRAEEPTTAATSGHRHRFLRELGWPLNLGNPIIGAMNLNLADEKHAAPQPVPDIARSYNVSQNTISRLAA